MSSGEWHVVSWGVNNDDKSDDADMWLCVRNAFIGVRNAHDADIFLSVHNSVERKNTCEREVSYETSKYYSSPQSSIMQEEMTNLMFQHLLLRLHLVYEFIGYHAREGTQRL